MTLQVAAAGGCATASGALEDQEWRWVEVADDADRQGATLAGQAGGPRSPRAAIPWTTWRRCPAGPRCPVGYPDR